jgi:hypothetical protein
VRDGPGLTAIDKHPIGGYPCELAMNISKDHSVESSWRDAVFSSFDDLIQ